MYTSILFATSFFSQAMTLFGHGQSPVMCINAGPYSVAVQHTRAAGDYTMPSLRAILGQPDRTVWLPAVAGMPRHPVVRVRKEPRFRSAFMRALCGPTVAPMPLPFDVEIDVAAAVAVGREISLASVKVVMGTIVLFFLLSAFTAALLPIILRCSLIGGAFAFGDEHNIPQVAAFVALTLLDSIYMTALLQNGALTTAHGYIGGKAIFKAQLSCLDLRARVSCSDDNGRPVSTSPENLNPLASSLSADAPDLGDAGASPRITFLPLQYDNIHPTSDSGWSTISGATGRRVGEDRSTPGPSVADTAAAMRGSTVLDNVHAIRSVEALLRTYLGAWGSGGGGHRLGIAAFVTPAISMMVTAALAVVFSVSPSVVVQIQVFRGYAVVDFDALREWPPSSERVIRVANSLLRVRPPGLASITPTAVMLVSLFTNVLILLASLVNAKGMLDEVAKIEKVVLASESACVAVIHDRTVDLQALRSGAAALLTQQSSLVAARAADLEDEMAELRVVLDALRSLRAYIAAQIADSGAPFLIAHRQRNANNTPPPSRRYSIPRRFEARRDRHWEHTWHRIVNGHSRPSSRHLCPSPQVRISVDSSSRASVLKS